MMRHRLPLTLAVALAGVAALFAGADLIRATLAAADESIIGWVLLVAGILLLLGSLGVATAE